MKKGIYELLSAHETRPIDELVERTGLNSSEVLATLFQLERKGHDPAMAGEAVRQGCTGNRKRHRRSRRLHLNEPERDDPRDLGSDEDSRIR